ncbi:Zn-ribbon domain-containing OB-fold protein [Mycolicibacterium vaccae]|uniref:Zn-ribbon domain-containing OB-fold protein n=1 Tax=Mycolicibacterium vaccae TaxID=1810 RepID=UPI003CFAA206
MPIFPVQRDAASAEFFDGTQRGEFLLVRDNQTGEFLSPQFDTTVDPERYTYVAAAGTGTVVSWSVIHQRAGEGVVHRLPVGIVELDEGPWWWTSFPEADPDADLFGARVRVAFQVLGGDEAEAIPYFTLI